MLENIREAINSSNELLSLSILLITGLILGELAKKIHLPRITGYIFGGIIIGNPVLHLISEHNMDRLGSINLIALGLMSITIGAHLNFHKLKNSGKRVLAVSVGEILLTFLTVFLAIFYLGGQSLRLSLMIATISISTSPAAIVAVVKETRSKGLFVNTLMPAVAINNVVAITIFGFVLSRMTGTNDINSSYLVMLTPVFKELIIDLIIGISAGFMLKYFAEKNINSDRHVLAMVFLAVMATTGVSTIARINPMLPNMIVGMFITNTSQFRSRILTVFEEIEYLIVIVFFALAGAHMDLGSLGNAGLLAVIYFLARAFGKIGGATTGAFLAKTPARIYRFIGISMIPQAGVAIGLVMLVGNIEELNGIMNFLTTFILATVAINEIIGPLAAKWALTKCEEAGRDRPKLIEFITEEFTLSKIKGTTKNEVIEEMIDFFVQSHKGTAEMKKEIMNSVMTREAESSTGIGHGIAIPHGVVKEGPIICGAIGLSKEGIEYDSVDEKPVHLIVLIVTPQNHKADMHLAVLAEISKVLNSESVREQLFKSDSAFEICDIIMKQEQGDFNYFLD